MDGAYAWRQSEKKVWSGSQREVKSLNDCCARLHQCVVRNAGEIRGVAMPSSRKRLQKRTGRLRNNEKENQTVSSFSITFSPWKTRESRRQCFNPSRALPCTGWSQARCCRYSRERRRRRRCRNEMFLFAPLLPSLVSSKLQSGSACPWQIVNVRAISSFARNICCASLQRNVSKSNSFSMDTLPVEVLYREP